MTISSLLLSPMIFMRHNQDQQTVIVMVMVMVMKVLVVVTCVGSNKMTASFACMVDYTIQMVNKTMQMRALTQVLAIVNALVDVPTPPQLLMNNQNQRSQKD